MVKPTTLMLGLTNSKRLAQNSLSGFTIKTCIDELAKNIANQIFENIHASPFVQLFLEPHGKQDLFSPFSSEEFQLVFA